FWSYDKTGKIMITPEACKRVGLHTLIPCSMSTNVQKSWSTKTYKDIEKWQILRGFDPKTTDSAQYLGYPTLEI
ncbi:hypothetical protein L218DRAFT_844143, partial [Marasmius fiardii PR-910]